MAKWLIDLEVNYEKIFSSTLALILFSAFFAINNTEAKDATEIGQYMGDCANFNDVCFLFILE